MEQFRQGRVRANGLSFATLEAGDGPLVLCLHGFPDHARSFRHQLPALAAAGFRAVAPFMRGYPPGAIPEDRDYSGLALGRDVIALAEHFGAQDAMVVGHDWGAPIVWNAAVRHPEESRRVRRHSPDGVFEGVLLPVTDPMEKEPGRERRVHDQTDVRARISESDRHARVVEQLLDRVHALVQEGIVEERAPVGLERDADERLDDRLVVLLRVRGE